MLSTWLHFMASLPGKNVTLDNSTGRVIESVESFSFRNRHHREVFVNQTLMDQVYNVYTPQVHNEAMLFSESTPFGDVTLDKLIYNGPMSALYTLEDYPNVIIKYVAHCDTGRAPHPLIQEYHYMTEASTHGLAPNAIFLSPPSLICEERIGKCAFTMPDKSLEFCRDNQKRTLRYFIMQKHHGLSLHEFRFRMLQSKDGQVGVRNAAVMGYFIIDLLEKIHMDAKIVHGDVHLPNIMVTQEKGSPYPKLQLIDFGRAFRRPETNLKEGPIIGHRTAFTGLIHPLYTNWQMRGHQWSARDDILKTAQIVAQLMQPFAYTDFETNMTSNPAAMLEWKEKGNWFISPLADPVASVPNLTVGMKRTIAEHLISFLNTARSLGINDPIPYDSLKASLLRVENIITNSRTTISAPNSTIAP